HRLRQLGRLARGGDGGEDAGHGGAAGLPRLPAQGRHRLRRRGGRVHADPVLGPAPGCGLHDGHAAGAREAGPGPVAAGDRRGREGGGAGGGGRAPPPPPAPGAEPGANDMERLVAWSWERVLGRHGIGADDNFFELGGDSLTALQVTALLKSRLGREVPIVIFYESPTVAQLAKALAPVREEKAEVVVEEVGQRAASRLDMMQRRRQARAQVTTDERG